MKVGITGSTGLIGTALIEALANAGHQAVPFIRSNDAVAGSVRWSPREHFVNDDDVATIGGVDAVVHLAGAGIADKRWSPQRRREILESRVLGTETIAQWIAHSPHPPTVLLSGSAIGFYGNRGDDVLDENSDGGTGFLSDVCRAWEAPAMGVTREGVRVAVLRTGIVMSPRGGALKKQLPLFRAGLGGRLGSGRQWASSISLRDTTAAIVHLLTHAVEGPVNLVAPEPARNRDVTTALAKAVRRPALFPVPPAALAVVLGKECAEEMLFASQRIVPQRLLGSGLTFHDPTIGAIANWACSDAAR
jgi:hypothetical protein